MSVDMEAADDLYSTQQSLSRIRTERSAARRVDQGDGEKPAADIGEEDDEEPLSPAAQIFHEPCFNAYVVAIAGCKTRIDVDVVKANLGHTLLRHPRFSSLQVKEKKNGREMMKWVRTEVDLEKHVIVPCLPVPDTADSSDKIVEDYVSDLSKTAIDFSKPLWEIHLLNLKTSDADSTAIFRIHHSLGDGVSLMSLVLACTRQISNPEALPSLPTAKSPSPGPVNSGGIWWTLQLVWNTIVDIVMFAATALFLSDTPTPLSTGDKRKKGAGGIRSGRRFVYRTVSLEDIKLIKNATKTTVNDVLMGVSMAALSRYLNRKYGETKGDKGCTEKKNNLPKNIRLRATLLINMRQSPGIHALAEMMEKNSKVKWGNMFGSILLPFTIALYDDPLEYVRRAKALIDRKKHSREAILTSIVIKMVLKLFGIKAAASLFHIVPSRTTMAFSNMVGPIEEIGYYGHPLVFLAPSSYGQPQGLMVHFQSYINKMTIVISVDEEIADPHHLCNDFEESVKLIKDAVIASGLIKEKTC